ncbi:MAG: 30S ribosomal protein S6 [Spirosomataceae bacterium]
MFTNQYETVFILTPVLSDAQMKDAVDKFKKVLADSGAELVHEESWGLRKLAYSIQHKNTGYYQLFYFNAAPSVIATLETEYKRDERIMRFLTVKLDKHSAEYNERRRKGLVGKKSETTSKPAEENAEKE